MKKDTLEYIADIQLNLGIIFEENQVLKLKDILAEFALDFYNSKKENDFKEALGSSSSGNYSEPHSESISKSNKYPPITDSSKMPYGKHKGVAMSEVPPAYLIWIYENGKCSDSIKDYIEENLEILRSELDSPY